MSTPACQPGSASSWKQEVSLRVAAHRSRAGLPTARPDTSVQGRQEHLSRAAQIAARVAARYAQAPSTSQMQAQNHAAQSAVPDALPGPPVVSTGAFPGEFDTQPAIAPKQPSRRAWEPAVVPAKPAAPSSLEAWESVDSLPGRPVFALCAPQPAEPVLLPQANIIEFPRELVAPRKRRPRRAEGPFAADGLERQLNIFAADPGAFHIQPGTAGMATTWTSPEWAGIELEALPQNESQPEHRSAAVSLTALRLEPIGLRLMAALVDSSLIAAAVLGAALAAAVSIGHPLPAGIAGFCVLWGLLLAGLLYQAIFLILDNATPGMRCAGLFLSTLDGQCPTRPQRGVRLGALLLSLLPAGLGVAWILFDGDHLCWHDRLSRTYLRKG